MLSETQTVSREGIDVRRLKFLLAIATQIAKPEVVGQNVDDVGLPFRRRGILCRAVRRSENEANRDGDNRNTAN